MSDNIVYVLGAGFSAALTELCKSKILPTMTNFFSTEDSKRKEFKTLFNWIETHYPPDSNVNPEHLMFQFQLMESEMLGIEDTDDYDRQKTEAKKLQEQLNNYIRTRMSIEDLNVTNKDFIKWIKKTCWGNHRIIIFNWDYLFELLYIKSVSCEENLERGSQEHVREFREFLKLENVGSKSDYESNFVSKHNPKFLKLHGSLNWYTCSNPYCPEHLKIHSDYSFIGEEIFPTFDHQQIPKGYCLICGSPMELAIVPPNVFKDINRYPKIKLMWQFAHRHISECDRLIIVGYSFPVEDLRVRYLFSSALFNNDKVECTIVDTNTKKVRSNLRNILPKIKFTNEKQNSYSFVEFLNDEISEK